MESLSRKLRHLLLIVLIILAVFGVGLSGGLPISQLKSREDNLNQDIEMLDEEKEKEKEDLKG